jgi:hypothetical protein
LFCDSKLPKDFVEKRRANFASGVDWDRGRPSVVVDPTLVAAGLPAQPKP